MSKKPKQKKLSVGYKRPLIWSVYLIVAISIYFVYILFFPNIFPRTDEKAFLCIPDSSTFDDVINILEKDAKVLNTSAFKQVAGLLQYGTKIRSGRFKLKSGMNNFQLVRILRSGRQIPVQLSFNNIRTKEQLAARLGSELMADSASIMLLLNDPSFLSTYNLKPSTSISIFIPNTYEVFWNTNAKEFFERMNKEYTKFWTNDRKAKAAPIPPLLPG